MRFLNTSLFLAWSLAAVSVPTLASPATVAARATPPAAAASEQARLRDAERRRADAVANRDVAALRTLVSGEYYHVETNGRVRGKAELLQLLSRDEYEFVSYETDDVDIRLLGDGHAAIVTGRLMAKSQRPDRPREFRGRFVRFWALDAGTWRNTLHQSTEIRSASLTR